VFVTHDQGEALVMSNRIAVMNAGRIEQIGGPADIYERPATRFVAEFIGRMNFFSGQATSAPRGSNRARVGDRGPLSDGIANGAECTSRSGRSARASLATSRMRLALEAPFGRCLYLGSTREFPSRIWTAASAGLVEMPNDGSAFLSMPARRVWLAASFDNCLVLPARS
jgi:hypothetical protein